MKQKQNKLGETLKSLRQSKPMTQIELAKLLNVDNTTVSAYERGNIQPTIEVVCKICFIFAVSADYLLGIDQDMKLSVGKLSKNEIILVRDLIEILERKGGKCQDSNSE